MPEVLEFLVGQTGMSPPGAYRTFNMGAGFAVYSPEGTGEEVVALAEAQGLRAHVAGHVTEGPRRVVLRELDVVFDSSDLDLGPRGTSARTGASAA